MTSELKQTVQDFISDFNGKQHLTYIVKPSIPIVWFGDVEKYLQSAEKIVTVALNPSLKEFEGSRFDIVDLQAEDAAGSLAKTLNEYFRRNPYNWFRDFEKVLSALGASYYERQQGNTAIHIDIYSAIATNPTWGKLSDSQKKNIRRTDLFEQLLKALNPDVIVFSANQTVFSEVFSKFQYENGEENINGKNGFFIRKYRDGNKILISGRNYRGQPFGGISDLEVHETMKKLLAE